MVALLRRLRLMRGNNITGQPAVPANAILLEDGSPMLAEDGSYLVTEA